MCMLEKEILRMHTISPFVKDSGTTRHNSVLYSGKLGTVLFAWKFDQSNLF